MKSEYLEIKDIELNTEKQFPELSAEITTANRRLPDRMWFRFKNVKLEWINKNADPFVTVISPLAARIGIPIKAEGVISSKLTKGIYEYWSIFNNWFPRKFTIPQIIAETKEKNSQVCGG